jgi:uncharacterized SAM-binding protein YcdF (DUF218 family)
MARLIQYVVSIGGLVWCLAAGVVWMLVAPNSRKPRAFLVLVSALYTLGSMHAVTRVASRPLVAGFRPFASTDAPQGVGAIVVLGAGTVTVPGRNQRIGILNLAGAARVLEAADVYRSLGSPWVISSGGTAHGRDLIPEAETMRDALVELGVPADRILLERMSNTTHDEALLVAPMLRSLHADPFVLVTSDVHMRRSLSTFRRAGVHPIPAIARDPLDLQSRWRSFVPTQQGIDAAGEVVHEYIGIAWYTLRGWQ